MKKRGLGVFCRNCGREIPNNANVCPECGTPQKQMKFCKHCGELIEQDCVICPKCGKQVEQITQAQPNIVINNRNENTNINRNVIRGGYGKPKNKWVAFFLCLFLGFFGGHKFYEGKTGMGILYLFTGGLFFVGVIIDLIALLFKPNPYYV